MHWQFNNNNNNCLKSNIQCIEIRVLSLICMRAVSECLFSNLLSECFSSGVPGWLGLREPDT